MFELDRVMNSNMRIKVKNPQNGHYKKINWLFRCFTKGDIYFSVFTAQYFLVQFYFFDFNYYS